MKKQESITPRKRCISVKLGVAEQPSTRVNKSRGYVSFGDDNLYPQYLIDLFENSPTHGAIINGKVKYIFGKGLYSDEPSMDMWLRMANRKESWNDLFFKLALDYEIHNRFYIEVVRTRDNSKRYYHLDASRIRVGDVEGQYVYSDEWRKGSRAKQDFFITYNRNAEIQRDKDGVPFREIIAYDEYRPNFDYYGYPNYLNVITSIEAEKEICNYDLNQWKYGFLGATMINLNNGAPETDEEEAEIVKTIKKTIGGGGGDNILVNFSDNKDTSAEIVGVKGDNSAQEADMTAKRISGTIFTGHTVTSPMLFGVKTEGQLGGRSEILEAYELFKETYISIRQNRLLSVIEDISGLEGLQVEELSPIQLDPNITEIAPYLTQSQVAKLIEKKYGLDFSDAEEAEVVEGATFKGAMSEEQERIFNACQSVGFSKKGYTEIASQGAKFKDGKLEFADLSELDLWILKILSDNPEYSAKEIAEEANINDAGIDISDVFLRIGKLIGLGWIIGEGAKYILSKLGEREAEKAPLPTIELETVYSYELRPDAQPLVPGGESRPFCKRMVESDLYYTKEAIEGLNNDLGTNVWMTRGGWLTKTGTDISLPFCRHWWVQKIVSKTADNSDIKIER